MNMYNNHTATIRYGTNFAYIIAYKHNMLHRIKQDLLMLDGEGGPVIISYRCV